MGIGRMNKASAVLIIGIIVLIVVSAVIFFYTGSDRTSDKSNNSKTLNNPNQVRVTDYYKINALSSFPGYELDLKNKEDIVELLDESWQIFGKKYVYKGVSTGEPLLYNIDLFVNNKKPPGRDPIFGQNTYLVIVQGKFQVYMYLTNTEAASSTVNEIITKNFLSAIYKATHPEASDQELNEEVEKGMLLLEEMGPEHFTFRKI